MTFENQSIHFKLRYDITWTTDRTWQKNLQPVSPLCKGIYLDRNYDFNFQTGENPCSEIFSGRSVFEAYELRFLETYQSRVLGYYQVLLTTKFLSSNFVLFNQYYLYV